MALSSSDHSVANLAQGLPTSCTRARSDTVLDSSMVKFESACTDPQVRSLFQGYFEGAREKYYPEDEEDDRFALTFNVSQAIVKVRRSSSTRVFVAKTLLGQSLEPILATLAMLL